MRNYTKLPDERVLKEILLSQAALDIIMINEKDAWLRLTSFHKNHFDGVDMVNIDNGSGDHIYILFSKYGTIIKGFDHESILSPYTNDEGEVATGIYEFVPDELLELLDDSVERNDATFCIWRSKTDTNWKKGNVVVPEDGDDGEGFLLGLIFEDADAWLDWAKSYYKKRGKQIQLDCVKKVYNSQHIPKEIVAMINPDRDIETAIKELKDIGFNVS